MFQGRYVRWNPIPKLEGQRMYCEAVHDDWEGFRIWLSPERPSRMLVVRFEHVLFYANSDEGKRLAPVENDKEMKFPHVFWKVENSALLAEFHRQSSGTSESLEITHFAFLSSSDCIDVLAVGEPHFEGHEDA
jgi:hypothetical protein